MIDLVAKANEIQNEYKLSLDKLATEKQELNVKENAIKKLQDSLNARAKELDLLSQEVDKKLKNISIDESLNEREKKIVTAEREQLKKAADLKSWENKLFQIESRHEREVKELAEKNIELENEKKTYREKIKSEILEDLKKRIA